MDFRTWIMALAHQTKMFLFARSPAFVKLAAALLCVAVVSIQQQRGRPLTVTSRFRRQMASLPFEHMSALTDRPVGIAVEACSDDGTLHLSHDPGAERHRDEYQQRLRQKELSKRNPLPSYRGTIKNLFYVAWQPANGNMVEKAKRFTSAWNEAITVVDEGNHWIPPRKYSEDSVIDLNGDFVAFNSLFPGNYGHFLHDHMPYIAHLRDILQNDMRILLIDNGGSDRDILKLIDPTFEANHVQWINQDQVYRIHGTLAYDTEVRSTGRTRYPFLVRKLRNWIEQNLSPRSDEREKRIIFYSCSGAKDVFHGRKVEPRHEKDILDLVQHSMQTHNRSEQLIIYNGYEDDGHTHMTIEKQQSLFRSASAIIGPHGSGMSNLIWMESPLVVNDCHDRPKMLEFLVTNELERVQVGGYGRSYYVQFSFPPWIEHHHVLYTNESTNEHTFVNLHDLEEALAAMRG